MPVRVDEAMLGDECPVEVVFERGEERVMRLVAGFEDVQVPQEYGRVAESARGQCGPAGGQPLLFAFRLLRPGVAGRHVRADDLERTARARDRYGSGPCGQVAHRFAEGVRLGLYPADDHDPVLAGPGNREVDVVTSGGERISKKLAAGTRLGLGKYENVLVTTGKPRKLTPGTLFGRVADIEGQQR